MASAKATQLRKALRQHPGPPREQNQVTTRTTTLPEKAPQRSRTRMVTKPLGLICGCVTSTTMVVGVTSIGRSAVPSSTTTTTFWSKVPPTITRWIIPVVGNSERSGVTPETSGPVLVKKQTSAPHEVSCDNSVRKRSPTRTGTTFDVLDIATPLPSSIEISVRRVRATRLKTTRAREAAISFTYTHTILWHGGSMRSQFVLRADARSSNPALSRVGSKGARSGESFTHVSKSGLRGAPID